jgi:hypothetical protein
MLIATPTPKPAAEVVVGMKNIPSTAKSKPTNVIFFIAVLLLINPSRRNCESPSALRDPQFLGATVLNTQGKRKSRERLCGRSTGFYVAPACRRAAVFCPKGAF